jgi:hypothetical protein
MKLTSRTVASLALLGPIYVCPAAPLFAQEIQDDSTPKPRVGIDELIPGGTQPDPKEEMTKLFQEVEQRLMDMGSYLLDAGAGDASRLAGVEASGIEELLKLARPSQPKPTGGIADLLAASQAEGQQVLEGIDRILEIAQENGGT